MKTALNKKKEERQDQNKGKTAPPAPSPPSCDTATAAQPTLFDPALGVEIDIDFAYSIALGYNKKLCFLIVSVRGFDFFWPFPSATRDQPEHHLQHFMDLMRLKIQSIRCDN